MKIAAQTNGTDLQIFVEDATWKKITLPLNREPVKIELLVCTAGEESIFHDAVSKSQPDTNERLMFCRDKLTLARFKQKLKKAGFGEPYEIRLGNSRLFLKKEFTDAHSVWFHDYKNNQAFNDWLSIFETLEAGFLLHRLKERNHYFSREFTEYREFNSMEEFIRHRFEIWHSETVKEFETALVNGTPIAPVAGMKGVYKGMETTYINGYDDFMKEENHILVEEDEFENANHIVMLMNSERSFGLLCASSPTKTIKVNAANMEKLKLDVLRLRCSYIPFKHGFNVTSEGGSVIRKEENCLFISGIDLDELLELAARYEQPVAAFGKNGELKSYSVQTGKPEVMLDAVDVKLAAASVLFNPGTFR